jgi:hypothetical protein
MLLQQHIQQHQQQDLPFELSATPPQGQSMVQSRSRSP